MIKFLQLMDLLFYPVDTGYDTPDSFGCIKKGILDHGSCMLVDHGWVPPGYRKSPLYEDHEGWFCCCIPPFCLLWFLRDMCILYHLWFTNLTIISVWLQEFYHRSSMKPKVFGMTASPVIRKGNKMLLLFFSIHCCSNVLLIYCILII